MGFRVKSSEIHPLPGNPHFLHLGTITKGLSEFIVIYGVRGPKAGKMYIEEAVLTSIDFSKDTYGNCKFIADDELALELARYAEEQGLTDMVKIANRLFATGRGSWLMGTNVL